MTLLYLIHLINYDSNSLYPLIFLNLFFLDLADLTSSTYGF